MFERLDVEFTVPVGDVEKHQVGFRWRQASGEAVLTIDGVEALRVRHPFGVSTIRRYEVVVGVGERHQVAVEKRKLRSYGGLRRQSFRAIVDDQLVGEY